MPDRRKVVIGIAASAAFPAPAALAKKAPRVVVIGGGFAGATCARALKRRDTNLNVVLVEPNARFTACPFSNGVIAGLRDIEAQQFGYDGLKRAGVEVIPLAAVGVDPGAQTVMLEDASDLDYARLVVAPGIDLDFNGLPGYDRAAAKAMPHAWKAGEQTLLLRRQLEAMEDGGLVVMSAPASPFRCPPGPYERASLIAYYLKTRKPRSKLLILDAKESFSKQKLFQSAWETLYPGLIEWTPLSFGGRVTEVDAASGTLVTEFGRHKAAVANVIPPQRAGAVAQAAGVADQTGWCPIDPVTFESRLQANIHVIGDAAVGGAMPKSAFTANMQAKVCAEAMIALLRGEAPTEQKLVNTCYSLVAPDYGISVAGVYQPKDGLLTEVEGAGGVSPLDAPASFRAQEAGYAQGWFRSVTNEVFG